MIGAPLKTLTPDPSPVPGEGRVDEVRFIFMLLRELVS
jgi:hypothetical protein